MYFDSINNKDFQQKFDGVQYRRKIRMRIYGTEDPIIKFEIKSKNGEYQHKSSLLIDRMAAESIMNRDYGVLLEYDNETAIQLYAILTLGQYSPVVLMEYDRRAFVYQENHTRITFDTNVKSSEMDYNLFSDDIPWFPITNEETVLEVKYDGRLYQPISMILSKYHLTNISFSKYGNGRPIMASYL